jgi:peptide chain release factor
MILLQLSAAQGPAECCLAVAKALIRLQYEATERNIDVSVLEQEPGPITGTLRSILLGLEGTEADTLATRWSGTLQWICTSVYRPAHRRKNWFIGAARFEPPPPAFASEIQFESLRSSGPGGQHVNTTDSAVRATHIASGISVKVQTERSQHANKRLAVLLIAQRLAQLAERADDELRAQRRLFHHRIARGNPARTFKGNRFEPCD